MKGGIIAECARIVRGAAQPDAAKFDAESCFLRDERSFLIDPLSKIVGTDEKYLVEVPQVEPVQRKLTVEEVIPELKATSSRGGSPDDKKVGMQ